ncbi:MAG: ubiquinone/menaquinone biosynthesis methyltransferase [SAR202 cluster bacterium]|nr:ubiquinone/menaquinone biosynthesis methyltransferase [SAR202 cluster bacterium]|tara:strand:+ start:100652 stop:101377 length:726 start_codon:yes stop_codon:yes gene_type:complete
MSNLHGKNKAKHVVSLFRRIAHNYDLLNTLMSAGRHHSWRKQAVKMLKLPEQKEGISLDVATGTGDFSIEISKLENVKKVFGIDFAKEMVVLAHKKSQKLSTMNQDFFYLQADALFLPFRNDVFQYVTIGFGIRNFYDLSKGLSEVRRVLKDDGELAILEIVKHEKNIFSKIFFRCFDFAAPLLGYIFARDRSAYKYLTKSAEMFFTANELTNYMDNQGFKIVSKKSLAFGNVSILICMKK